MRSLETQCRLSIWFRQWRNPLRRFLLYKAGIRAADVDDIAQEVFLRFVRYDRGKPIEHPQAYLYKIAANVAAEWSTRARSRVPHEERWLTNLKGGDQPDSLMLRDQLQSEIERALNTLSPRQREVIKLHFSEELHHAAIAELTGETLRCVRRHFSRGYERLRHELDPQLLRDCENETSRRGCE